MHWRIAAVAAAFLSSSPQLSHQQQQEAEPWQQREGPPPLEGVAGTSPTPRAALSFAEPPGASCDSSKGRFFMSPSRHLDPVVMLRRPKRGANSSITAGSKLCLRVQAVNGRSEDSAGNHVLHLSPPSPQGYEHCSMDPDPTSELFAFHLRNLKIGGWGYYMRAVYDDDSGGDAGDGRGSTTREAAAGEQSSRNSPPAACWVVVGRMASPSPPNAAVPPPISTGPLPRAMSIEEALAYGKSTLRGTLALFNGTTSPPSAESASSVAHSNRFDDLGAARRAAEWIAQTAEEMVRLGHSVSSLASVSVGTSAPPSTLSAPSFSHPPAANLYFESAVLAPKLAAELVAAQRRHFGGAPTTSLGAVLATDVAVTDSWNAFDAESLYQRCEAWQVRRERSSTASSMTPKTATGEWLKCLREGRSRWPQHPLWSLELGRALLVTADSGDGAVSRDSPWEEACPAFESAAAVGSHPIAKLHLALCEEALRDNSLRAAAILRSAIVDAIYRGSFRSGEVSIGALLIRLATVTPRIIASPSWRGDLTSVKALSAEDALKVSRSALADDLSCLVSIGRPSAHACGSARGRVTRLLAEVCGKGWWKDSRSSQQLTESTRRNASHSSCGSPDVICSSGMEPGRKRLLLCDPSRGACANALLPSSRPTSAAPIGESGRKSFCNLLAPPSQLHLWNMSGSSCSWPSALRLAHGESVLQQSLSLGFFWAFHGHDRTPPTDAHLKYLLGRAYRCLASRNESFGIFAPPAGLLASTNTPEATPMTTTSKPLPQRSVRVAVVSRFLHSHSVGLLMVGVLEDIASHRPPREARDLEVHIFSTNPNRYAQYSGSTSGNGSEYSDPIVARIRAAASSFTQLPTNDLQAARSAILSHFTASSSHRAASSEVPLFFDVVLYPELGMDQVAYFLAQGRVAAVQVAWWGHPSSSGSSCIDYFIAGGGDDDASASRAFSEQLVRFGSLGTKFDRRLEDDATLESAASDMRVRLISDFKAAFIREVGEDFARTLEIGVGPIDVRLYLCVQSLFKWHPRFISDALLPILIADPRAVVVAPLPSRSSGHAVPWSHRLREAVTSAAADAVARRAKESGVGGKAVAAAVRRLVARVHLIPRVASGEMATFFRAGDAVLDTFPFGGGVTSLQTIAAGVAPITLPEPGAWSGQLTKAMYRQLAVAARDMEAEEEPKQGRRNSSWLGPYESCVARNAADYAMKAVRLAKDPALRWRLRELIRVHAHGALFYDQRAAREWAHFLYAVVP